MQEEGTLHEVLVLFVAEAIGRGVEDVDAMLDEADDAGLLPDEAAVDVLASILKEWGCRPGPVCTHSGLPRPYDE